MGEPINDDGNSIRGCLWAVVLVSPFWFLVGAVVVWWWQR